MRVKTKSTPPTRTKGPNSHRSTGHRRTLSTRALVRVRRHSRNVGRSRHVRASESARWHLRERHPSLNTERLSELCTTDPNFFAGHKKSRSFAALRMTRHSEHPQRLRPAVGYLPETTGLTHVVSGEESEESDWLSRGPLEQRQTQHPTSVGS